MALPCEVQGDLLCHQITTSILLDMATKFGKDDKAYQFAVKVNDDYATAYTNFVVKSNKFTYNSYQESKRTLETFIMTYFTDNEIYKNEFIKSIQNNAASGLSMVATKAELIKFFDEIKNNQASIGLKGKDMNQSTVDNFLYQEIFSEAINSVGGDMAEVLKNTTRDNLVGQTERLFRGKVIADYMFAREVRDLYKSLYNNKEEYLAFVAKNKTVIQQLPPVNNVFKQNVEIEYVKNKGTEGYTMMKAVETELKRVLKDGFYDDFVQAFLDQQTIDAVPDFGIMGKYILYKNMNAGLVDFDTFEATKGIFKGKPSSEYQLFFKGEDLSKLPFETVSNDFWNNIVLFNSLDENLRQKIFNEYYDYVLSNGANTKIMSVEQYNAELKKVSALFDKISNKYINGDIENLPVVIKEELLMSKLRRYGIKTLSNKDAFLKSVAGTVTHFLKGDFKAMKKVGNNQTLRTILGVSSNDSDEVVKAAIDNNLNKLFDILGVSDKYIDELLSTDVIEAFIRSNNLSGSDELLETISNFKQAHFELVAKKVDLGSSDILVTLGKGLKETYYSMVEGIRKYMSDLAAPREYSANQVIGALVGKDVKSNNFYYVNTDVFKNISDDSTTQSKRLIYEDMYENNYAIVGEGVVKGELSLDSNNIEKLSDNMMKTWEDNGYKDTAFLFENNEYEDAIKLFKKKQAVKKDEFQKANKEYVSVEIVRPQKGTKFSHIDGQLRMHAQSQRDLVSYTAPARAFGIEQYSNMTDEATGKILDNIKGYVRNFVGNSADKVTKDMARFFNGKTLDFRIFERITQAVESLTGNRRTYKILDLEAEKTKFYQAVTDDSGFIDMTTLGGFVEQLAKNFNVSVSGELPAINQELVKELMFKSVYGTTESIYKAQLQLLDELGLGLKEPTSYDFIDKDVIIEDTLTYLLTQSSVITPMQFGELKKTMDFIYENRFSNGNILKKTIDTLMTGDMAAYKKLPYEIQAFTQRFYNRNNVVLSDLFGKSAADIVNAEKAGIVLGVLSQALENVRLKGYKPKAIPNVLDTFEVSYSGLTNVQLENLVKEYPFMNKTVDAIVESRKNPKVKLPTTEEMRKTIDDGLSKDLSGVYTVDTSLQKVISKEAIESDFAIEQASKTIGSYDITEIADETLKTARDVRKDYPGLESVVGAANTSKNFDTFYKKVAKEGISKEQAQQIWIDIFVKENEFTKVLDQGKSIVDEYITEVEKELNNYKNVDIGSTDTNTIIKSEAQKTFDYKRMRDIHTKYRSKIQSISKLFYEEFGDLYPTGGDGSFHNVFGDLEGDIIFVDSDDVLVGAKMKATQLKNRLTDVTKDVQVKLADISNTQQDKKALFSKLVKQGFVPVYINGTIYRYTLDDAIKYRVDKYVGGKSPELDAVIGRVRRNGVSAFSTDSKRAIFNAMHIQDTIVDLKNGLEVGIEEALTLANPSELGTFIKGNKVRFVELPYSLRVKGKYRKGVVGMPATFMADKKAFLSTDEGLNAWMKHEVWSHLSTKFQEKGFWKQFKTPQQFQQYIGPEILSVVNSSKSKIVDFNDIRDFDKGNFVSGMQDLVNPYFDAGTTGVGFFQKMKKADEDKFAAGVNKIQTQLELIKNTMSDVSGADAQFLKGININTDKGVINVGDFLDNLPEKADTAGVKKAVNSKDYTASEEIKTKTEVTIEPIYGEGEYKAFVSKMQDSTTTCTFNYMRK